MIEIIKGVLNRLNEYDVYSDEVSQEVIQRDGFGIYYTLNTVQDEQYRQDYDLQICIAGLNKDKINIIQQGEIIDSILNKADITPNSRIIHKNPYINAFVEGEDFTMILEYFIRDIKGA